MQHPDPSMPDQVILPKNTFSKAERLCSVKIISELFDSGNIFHNSLFKVVWKDSPAHLPFPAQVAFSVSKKSFKKAVTRNLVRRRMREAYRKSKHLLYDKLFSVNRQFVFMIIFKGSAVPTYDQIQKNIEAVISTLTRKAGEEVKC